MKNLIPIALALCLVCLLPAASFAQEKAEPVSVLTEAPAPAEAELDVQRERVLAFQVALNQLAEQNRFRPLQASKLRRAAKDAALCEYLAIRYSAELDEVASEVAAGDQFYSFIKFIIANQESIFKFINTLIDLFS
jgi:hypothetical protein